MPLATLALSGVLGALLGLAPPSTHAPNHQSYVPSLNEWELAGDFRLKSERFLAWQPIYHVDRGWEIELAPLWRIELTTIRTAAVRPLIAIESTPVQRPGHLGESRPQVGLTLPPGRQLGALQLTLGRTLFSPAGLRSLSLRGRF